MIKRITILYEDGKIASKDFSDTDQVEVTAIIKKIEKVTWC